jgi:hypothetical protein
MPPFYFIGMTQCSDRRDCRLAMLFLSQDDVVAQYAYSANIAKVVGLYSLILPRCLEEDNHRPTSWGNVSWRACKPASVSVGVWILCYRRCCQRSGH